MNIFVGGVMMGVFGANVKGQVSSIQLHKNKALWPLFETIVNSIQSIEDSENSSSGNVKIIVERNKEQLTLEGDDKYAPFTHFTVIDNGEGFNQSNYDSFLTTHTDKKIAKGCKGIGRFLWLKAFESVEVKSSFFEKDEYLMRAFEFTVENEIKPENNIKVSHTTNLETSIKLINFQSPYKEQELISLDQLAEKIVEHCLPYFLTSNCPELTLYEENENPINLKDYFNNEMEGSFSSDVFQIEGESFVLHHFKLKNLNGKHELHLCANNREVKSKNLSKLIPNLTNKIYPERGEPYFYNGYLTGNILDESINLARTNFHIEDVKENLFGDLTMDQVLEKTTEVLTHYLDDDLRRIKKLRKDEIDKFVNHVKPQYKYLLNQKPESYEKIKAGLSQERLELELHKLEQAWELEIHTKGQEIEEKIKTKKIDETFLEEAFNAYMSSVNEIQKSSLTEHVTWRKSVIDLLEKTLKSTNGKYNREDVIHSLICPMGVTSDEIPFEEMNLWLIDDRLSYHEFLSSDKPFSSISVIDATEPDRSCDRMDISIFNTPLSFSEGKIQHNSISIIELKKAMRNDYNRQENDPIDQVLGYVKTLRSGNAISKDGRPLTGLENVAFYCYIIADLTPSLVTRAENSGYTKTIDGGGFFGYNGTRNAYVQIISYNKIIEDAKKRNQILFDKLWRPKR